MNKIITTSDGQTYNKPSTMQNIGGIVAGSLASSATGALLIKPSTAAIDEMRKTSQSIDSIDIAQKGTEALELGNVKDKVSFITFSTNENKTMNEVMSDAVDEIVNKILNKSADSKKTVKFTDLINHLAKKMCEHGYNAAFDPSENKIWINFEKLGASVFHEIGHSMNFNNSKFWKGMQHLRLPCMLMASLFPTVALFKRAKAPNEEPKNIFDKVTTFIKDNVGKLTTFAFVPIVAEELKASANGKKLAKKLVDEATLKKVIKTNRLGASTYIATGIVSGVGAYLGNKLKDQIAKPKLVENNTNNTIKY